MAGPTPSPSSSPSASRGPNTSQGDPNSVYPSTAPSSDPKKNPGSGNKAGANGWVTFDGPGLAEPHKDMAWTGKPGGVKYGDYIYSTGAVSDEYKVYSDPFSEGYNEWQTKASLEGSWVNLSDAERRLFNGIAAGKGHNSTGPGVYSDMVAQSAALGNTGEKLTPYQIAYRGILDGSLPFASSGNGPGGGGSGSSTNTRITHFSESDLRTMADKLGLDMVGRGVTDDEFKKALAQIRKAENSNPAVTTATTSDPGITQTGREDIIQNIIAKSPEYGDYQQATTMMDWFDKALNERIQNG